MKKFATLGLALLLASLYVTSALAALTPNHSYTVQLGTLTAAGQQTAVAQMQATTDANGKLNFQFSNIPDTGTAPFLMVQIMDTVGGQQQVVRQTLIPAPTAGQQLQMGVNEVSYRQTQAALQAMQNATDSDQATLGAMLPLTMIPTGALNSSEAGSMGQAALSGAAAFQAYLTQNGVTNTQMTALQSGLLNAMQQLAAANKNVVGQTDPSKAAGLSGQAGAQFMAALIKAGSAAGIDPSLIANAFDQAGQAIDNSSALGNLPSGAIEAMHATMLAGAQQRQVLAQMGRYAAGLPVVGATTGAGSQTQTFTSASIDLQNAMAAARQNFYQSAFADPSTLPDPTTVEQALANMETAMQGAFGTFTTATTATNSQITDMLSTMATTMNSMMGSGGGMMGGGSMSFTYNSLGSLGFGMMQTTATGTTQNWSTMMVAASNLLPNVPNMTYTPDTADLTNQLAQLAPANMPTAPDWSQIPDSPDKSLLQLQYDLMLVHLIDMQTAANFTTPVTQADLAALSAQDLANRAAIRQGLQGLTASQMDALMATLSPPQLL